MQSGPDMLDCAAQRQNEIRLSTFFTGNEYETQQHETHRFMRRHHFDILLVWSFCRRKPSGAPLINKDQVEGRVGEAKGSVKEITGKILDDKGMELEGNIQKNVGKVQAGYGDLKKNIQEGK